MATGLTVKNSRSCYGPPERFLAYETCQWIEYQHMRKGLPIKFSASPVANSFFSRFNTSPQPSTLKSTILYTIFPGLLPCARSAEKKKTPTQAVKFDIFRYKFCQTKGHKPKIRDLSCQSRRLYPWYQILRLHPQRQVASHLLQRAHRGSEPLAIFLEHP